MHPGGKFDSEDEDKTSEQSAPGVSEFKDDDEFSMKKSPRPNLPRKPSGGPSDLKAKKSSKPSRKVDLGAAAAFASKAKDDHQQQPSSSFIVAVQTALKTGPSQNMGGRRENPGKLA